MSVTCSSADASLRRLLIALPLVAVAIGSLFASATASRAAEPNVVGHWKGTLKAGAIELRIIFNISKTPQGQLSANMDSPDQGAKGLPMDTVKLEGDTLTLEARRIAAGYQGAVSADGQQIKGQWKQAGQSMPLDLVRLEKEPDYTRPQEPTRPYPYDQQEVTLENKAAGIKLAGTLTLPRSSSPVPAVVLLTGSGAGPRREHRGTQAVLGAGRLSHAPRHRGAPPR